MKILVTGASGFIGSHLVDALLDEGHEVLGMDNFSSGNIKNLDNAFKQPGFNVYNGDITDDGNLQTAFSLGKPDFIFHLAADAKVANCTLDPIKTSEVNYLATIKLLQKAVEHQVKGFVFSSSCAVYGDVIHKDPIPESARLEPVNIYGVQKAASDMAVRLFYNKYGLPTVSLRYFNVYGTARQSISGPYVSAFAAFMSRRLANEGLVIYGDGNQERDYVHVFDVVKANMLLLKKPKTWKGWGEAFNIGTGEATRTEEVAWLVDEVCKPKNEVIDYVDQRPDDIKYSCSSCWRAQSDLKFFAEISVEEGVKILKQSYDEI
jgi:UDP-glucose 4-epimerase